MKKHRSFALSLVAALSFTGIMSGNMPHAMAQSVKAHETAWKKVSFHDTVGSREEKIISDTYGKLPFFKRHPDVRLESSVVRLDNGKNGSIAIRFLSQGTCRADNSCLTTVIWHDDNPASTGWKEVWTGRTSTLWIGPQSPTAAGAGMRELAGDDKIVWRWIGQPTYFPDPRSIAKPWGKPTIAGDKFTSFAKKVHPEYMAGNPSAFVQDTIVPIQGIMTAHLLTYINARVCGQVGCPFILAMGNNDSNFESIGEGIIADGGGSIMNTENGYNTLVTQLGSTGLAFYSYEKGYYKKVREVFSNGPSQ